MRKKMHNRKQIIARNDDKKWDMYFIYSSLSSQLFLLHQQRRYPLSLVSPDESLNGRNGVAMGVLGEDFW